MSSTIEVPPDIAAKIEAQAQARGVPVDVYLRMLIEEQEGKKILSPQEKARLWREWAASHSHNTPLLSDEAISRESIYEERG